MQLKIEQKTFKMLIKFHNEHETLEDCYLFTMDDKLLTVYQIDDSDITIRTVDGVTKIEIER